MKDITGILLCAGFSLRMGYHKLLYPLPNGKTPMQMSLEALVKGGVNKLVIVTNEATHELAKTLSSRAGVPVTLTEGGETRQESVYNGLLCASPGIAVIHDAARCMTFPRLVQNCIDSALLHGSGVAAIPVSDTVFRVGPDENGDLEVLPREELLSIQTPQAFDYKAILSAYELSREKNTTATDDSTLYAAAGHTVRFVRGHIDNRKLTTPNDIAWLEERLFAMAANLNRHTGLRAGVGEDVHLLAEHRPLILGGVNIPYERGLVGHSDADVILHALMDAMLGAAGLGDIGTQFPDTDKAYEGISSMELLQSVMILIKQKGYAVSNVDVTLVAQRPRIATYIPKMRAKISSVLGVSPQCVGLKATTTEGSGPEGRGECMRANAIALLHASN